jgi:hypothetical protein
MERSPIDIKQTVDIWSLGCVLSEVAVWLVHDTDRLEAYRQERQDDASRVFEFKDGRAFHDSLTVLSSVSSMHEEVLKNVRKSDYVTEPVVRKMITEMLDEVDGRPNTKQLFRKSENILRDAKKQLTSTTKEQPEPEMHSQRRTPPIVPLQSRNNPTACSGGPGRCSPLRHTENRRSATIDVLARDDRRSPEATADAEYESPDELSKPTETSPTSTSHPYPGDRSQNRRQLTHDNTYQSTPQAQQSSLRDLGQNHSPTSPGKVSTRDSIKRNSDGPDQLQVESGPLQSRFVQTTNTTKPSPSSPTYRAARSPPYTSLDAAETWMHNKKHNRTNLPPLEHSEYLEKLKERDHVRSFSCPLVQIFWRRQVFLVDDAATMSPYWSEVTKVVHVLSYLLKKTDEDGMDLCFTVSKDTYNSKKSSTFLRTLQRRVKAGTSDIGSSLSTILQQYKTYLQEEAPSRRLSLFSKPKPEGKKALNVYVLTDAVWEPESNAAEPVTSLVGTLEKLGYSRNQVGIQFIRFGDDPEGIKKLEHLDSGLGLPM